MVEIALVGAGKMGLSHLAILGAHPDVKIVGVCDKSKLVNGVLQKYSGYPCYTDFVKMLDDAKPQAVFIAVPTKFHYDFVKILLDRNIHVFVEKPFCLTYAQSDELSTLAEEKGLVNQVGYHNKFVGTFQELKRLIKGGYLGNIQHFLGEAYGPVVIKAKQETWRSDPLEGGGCLMDYASHVIDLINDILSPVISSSGSQLKSIYSNSVDDMVYSLLELSDKTTGNLSVNWSDETYRKMSTSLTIFGSKGKIICDANELRVYFKGNDFPEGYTNGWNVKYITDLTAQADFYLRGEEYSLQIDHFVKSVMGVADKNINTFRSAAHTDKAIEIIKNKSKK